MKVSVIALKNLALISALLIGFTSAAMAQEASVEIQEAASPAEQQQDQSLQPLMSPANEPPAAQPQGIQAEVSLSLHQVEMDIPLLAKVLERQNIDIRIANSRIKQAAGSYIGSFAPLMPSLRGSAFVEKFTGSDIIVRPVPVAVDRVTFRPRVMLDYQLPLGGRPLFQISATKAYLKANKEEKNHQIQLKLLDALTEYYTWLRDRAVRDVAEQSLREADMHLQVKEARLKAGFGTQLEVEQAKIQQAERQDLVLDYRNRAEISRTQLSSTLNLPISTDLLPKHEVLLPVRYWNQDEASPAELLKIAEAKRPDIQERLLKIKEARAMYLASFSELFPTIGVTSYYGGVGPKTEDLRETFQRGVFLNMDLLRNMGVSTIGNIKTNKGALEESILTQEKYLLEIRNTLTEAYYDWERYKKQIVIMKRKADAAQEAFRIANAKEKRGFGIHLEALKAQTDLTRALEDMQTAILNYNVSQLRLLYETGQLTPMAVLARYEESIYSAEDLPVKPVKTATAETQNTPPKNTLAPASTH